MKIFISWSGKRSLGVATALREWLPLLFQGIELFVSSEDIRKGKRWPAEVSKELDSSNFGIVCLTHDNLQAPWLVFEAGALSKSVKEASVYTLLAGGLRMSDVQGPLSHFQHTVFERDDFFKLMKSINEAQGQGNQEETRLRKIFDKFWDELDSTVAKAVKADSKPEKTRSQEEMLNEILELASYIARNMPDPREQYVGNLGTRDALSNSDPLFIMIAESLENVNHELQASFMHANKVEIDGDTLTIRFPQEHAGFVKVVTASANVRLFEKILQDLGYPGVNKVFGLAYKPPPPRKGN